MQPRPSFRQIGKGMQRKVRIRRPIADRGARPEDDHPAPCALCPGSYEGLGLEFGILVVVLEAGVVPPKICLVHNALLQAPATNALDM